MACLDVFQKGNGKRGGSAFAKHCLESLGLKRRVYHSLRDHGPATMCLGIQSDECQVRDNACSKAASRSTVDESEVRALSRRRHVVGFPWQNGRAAQVQSGAARIHQGCGLPAACA